MELDPDCYSKYTLRWFAAAINAIGLVAFGAITYGICMMIEWWAA
ncbi:MULTISPECIES: hypothetical protein [Enterobacteriaceae]|nr:MULTISPECIES: hypothetical protein [Enterobacteriaceae]MCT9036348.1 hypothetical protein [Enterobacter cloacae]MCW9345948.1 hypothetical protein [Klebsiella pneumoniae]MDA5079531.1 hypothetical protein [Klebsiella pneumoniae]MDA5084890.1 hypothetical protein [Klebsiella pneumoniae]MDC8819755.1 hypothetical protein [Klebsiella pneumoniae]